MTDTELHKLSEFQFWTQIYRAVMMIAKAIVRYKLTKTPEGQRSIITDTGLIAGIPGYDIDIERSTP